MVIGPLAKNLMWQYPQPPEGSTPKVSWYQAQLNTGGLDLINDIDAILQYTGPVLVPRS